MAIILQKQVLDGQGGSYDGKSYTNQLRIYIKFDTPMSNTVQAISAGGFIIGQEHPTASALSLASVSAEAVDGYNWFFDCEYNLEATYENDEEELEDARVKVEWGSWREEVSIPLLNGAGDLIDPSPVRPIYWPQIRITKPEQDPNPSRLLLQGHVNDAQISLLGITIPAYCAQLVEYSPQPMIDAEGEEYFDNTFVINLCFKKAKADDSVIGFQKEYINAGFNVVNPSYPGTGETPTIPIVEKGVAVDTPRLLSADGTQVVKSDNINYILYTPEETTAFNAFGLPTNYQRR